MRDRDVRGDYLRVCLEDHENLERLASALEELEAEPKVKTGGVMVLDSYTLEKANWWQLTTKHADMDVVFMPDGTEGYPDLIREARYFQVGNQKVPVADLLDVIRSKEAADRPKDRASLPGLRDFLTKVKAKEAGDKGLL